MSGGIPDIAGLGYLPLRHEDDRVEIGLRHIVNAVGIKRIDPLDPNLITEVPGSTGDLISASVWINDRSKRNCAGWSFAWPVMVTRPETKSGSGTGSTIRGQDETQKVRPIRDAEITADDRFEEKGPSFPAWAHRLPKGWTGVGVAATNENRQEMTLHPSFLGLVSAEVGADPDLSSVVLDTDDQNRVDPERRAHLNAMMRVVKAPATKINIGTQNGIAWQHGIGKGGRGGGGLIARAGAHGGASLACMADFAGGPVSIPGAGDQHQIGQDGDGNPISAAHLSTAAIFKSPLDSRKDSPVAFEEAPFPAKLEPGQFLTAAHLRWNAAAGHSWGSPAQQGRGLWQLFAETLMYVPEPEEPPPPTAPPPTSPPPTSPPPTTPRPPKRKGRREPPPTSPPPPEPLRDPPATTPGGGGRVDPPTEDSDPPFTEPARGPSRGRSAPDDGPNFEEPVRKGAGRIGSGYPGDDLPQNPKPWRPPGKPSGSIDGPTGLQRPPPADGPAGGQYEPDPARGDETSGDPNRPLFPPEGGADGKINDPTRDLGDGPVEGPFGPNPWESPPGEDDGRKRHRRDRVYVEASRREIVDRVVAAVLLELSVSAIAMRPGSFACGGIDLSGSMRPTPEEVAEHDKRSPVMARIEGAWAKPGGDCNSGQAAYTARPGAARYVGGTASGVVGYFPAEVGMRDHASGFAPPGVDVSTVHHTALKGKVFFGSGLPDPTGGLNKSGNYWDTGASQVLEVKSTTAAGAVDKTRTLPNRTGSILLAPAALTAGKLLRADANGDAEPAGFSDNELALTGSDGGADTVTADVGTVLIDMGPVSGSNYYAIKIGGASSYPKRKILVQVVAPPGTPSAQTVQIQPDACNINGASTKDIDGTGYAQFWIVSNGTDWFTKG